MNEAFSRLAYLRFLLAASLAALGLTTAVALVVRDEARPEGETVSSVVEDPERFIGRRITVTGDVGEVLAAKALTLADDSHQLLVVDVPVIPALDDDLDGLVTDERVEVTGVVRRFAAGHLEPYAGALEGERFEAFTGQPVIVAEQFAPADT